MVAAAAALWAQPAAVETVNPDYSAHVGLLNAQEGSWMEISVLPKVPGQS
jgi:hypothetical protein